MLSEELISNLTHYEKPILTFIDAQGFPFSVPVDYEVVKSSNTYHLKLSGVPDQAKTASSKNMNLLFNHIDALPQGGYGNRRYIQFYGSLNNDEFVVTSIKGWNEKEVDFLSLVQRSLPRGIAYLKDFNKELFDKTLQENDSGMLLTTVSGLINTKNVKFVKDKAGNMYFYAQFIEPSIRQLDLNPNVKLLLEPPKGYKISGKIELDARASIVKDKQVLDTIIPKLREQSPEIDTALHVLKDTTRIVKLEPVKMTYGAKTELETYEVPGKKRGLLSELKSSLGLKLKYWMFATRAPFFTASIVPVAVGGATAYYVTNQFNWSLFWLTLIGLFFIHAGANILNDYFDHISDNDDFNSLFSPFNGGSRFIQSGLASPAKMFYSGMIAMVLGSAIGLYLNYVTKGNVILYIGLIGFVLATFYSGRPFKFAYHGLGDIAVFLGFGPLPVIGTFYVLTQEISWDYLKYPVMASVPIGILVTLILFINSFQDMDADALARKNTSIVRLGKKRAVRVYISLLVLTYLWVGTMILLGFLPLSAILSFLTLPLAWYAIKNIKTLYAKIYELLPVNVATIGTHFVFGILLSLGIALGVIFT